MTSTILLVALTTLANADEPVGQDGNQLMAAAVDALLKQPSIEAKIRQRASILNQFVAGAGLYVQTRQDDRLLVRFEFKLQVGEKSHSILHINDGSILWMRRDIGNLQSHAYVNLRRLREAAEDQAAAAPPRLDANHLAVGGLGQLLQSLTDRFDFGTAKESEIAGIPMWELSGEWKKEQLKKWLPADGTGTPAMKLQSLPPHLPTTVKLTLGRDQKFPLFPYRIEFGRLQMADGAGKTAAPNVHPLVTMELFEVRRRTNLSPDLFSFPVGDETVEDQTELYLKKIFDL